jgi:hypothetical protein
MVGFVAQHEFLYLRSSAQICGEELFGIVFIRAIRSQ